LQQLKADIWFPTKERNSETSGADEKRQNGSLGVLLAQARRRNIRRTGYKKKRQDGDNEC
jgi:hypothetical protein